MAEFMSVVPLLLAVLERDTSVTAVRTYTEICFLPLHLGAHDDPEIQYRIGVCKALLDVFLQRIRHIVLVPRAFLLSICRTG